MTRTPRQSLEAFLSHPEFLDVSDLPNVRVDLRYGTKYNLLNRDIYGGFQRALLHRLAAGKFAQASMLLSQEQPELKFVIFDALRPQSAQREFWKLVEGTPQQHFFANPERGSIHSFGFALDLSLLGPDGTELDMGTPFDDMSELAGPRFEARMLSDGLLSAAQQENRLLLRGVMEAAGFHQLPHEWWHYDALPAAEVRARFPRCE